MAGVRDPAFWRRFSMAVHLDEEKASPTNKSSSSVATQEIKHTDSWLERNKQKQRRAKICGWVILTVVLIAAAGITIVLLWYLGIGPFKNISPTTHHSNSRK